MAAGVAVAPTAAFPLRTDDATTKKYISEIGGLGGFDMECEAFLQTFARHEQHIVVVVAWRQAYDATTIKYISEIGGVGGVSTRKSRRFFMYLCVVHSI